MRPQLDLRAEVHERETLSYRIRAAKTQRVLYMAIVGECEAGAGTVGPFAGGGAVGGGRGFAGAGVRGTGAGRVRGGGVDALGLLALACTGPGRSRPSAAVGAGPRNDANFSNTLPPMAT